MNFKIKNALKFVMLIAISCSVPMCVGAHATEVKTDATSVQPRNDRQNGAPKKSCKPEYPAQSLRHEEEGITLLEFWIKPDGIVAEVVVLNSSGSTLLDQAAVDALSNCPFPTPIVGFGADSNWVPVQYNWFMGSDPRTSLIARKLKLASDGGDANARYHLNLILRTFAKSDDERQDAISLLQSAAAQGHAHAQFELGRNYERGTLVPADINEAMRWYMKAADQGDKFAIQRLKLGKLWY